MSTHKHIDRICIFGLVFALLLSALFVSGSALGIQPAKKDMGYENRLFDTSRVHTIDIVMEDWDSFISSCRNEEYSVCSMVIDGEAFKNVAIRGKGNTSLSNVASMNSDRYSFKVEFDHYDSTKTYHGLDKLSLNNIIQDTTFMKDYLTYQLMGSFGAAAPLCSYVYITVNGEDWGLYLAVESIENSFLQRNYGNDHGELYKPDSMSFGGGRGNGKDFNMDDFMENWNGISGSGSSSDSSAGVQVIRPPNMEAFRPTGNRDENNTLDRFADMDGNMPGMGGFGGFGMGSSDVLLQYTDDDPANYSNIFSSAKTDITEADQIRLIRALKALSEGDAENSVNIEQVIRYFVVHNFVVNGDSYTGSMIHNYYLYEEDGTLEMLPWDYNLAFGTFQGNNASNSVNDPIDTPLSVTGSGRPIIDWIFANEEYTELYHRYFSEFLEDTDFAAIIDTTVDLIAPYVEKDPSKFCSYEEFQAGTATLRAFCLLREESVQKQLDGIIPTTSTGQKITAATLVDASQLNLSAMGSMGMGGGRGGNFVGFCGNQNGNTGEILNQNPSENRPGRQPDNNSQSRDKNSDPNENNPFSGMVFPNFGDFSQNIPKGEFPGSPSGQMQRPAGMTPPTGNMSGSTNERPTGGFRPENMNTVIPDGTASSNSSASLLPIGISVILLAAALIVAKKYRR